MSTQGIEIEVTFVPPAPFTDEWLDAVYSSLEKNMAIVSIDLMTAGEGVVRFLFGIDNFLDSENFAETIAQEALERAFADAAGPNDRAQECNRRATVVEEFA